MYAVIEQGSRQYKVAEGDCVNIDLLSRVRDNIRSPKAIV